MRRGPTRSSEGWPLGSRVAFGVRWRSPFQPLKMSQKSIPLKRAPSQNCGLGRLEVFDDSFSATGVAGSDAGHGPVAELMSKGTTDGT